MFRRIIKAWRRMPMIVSSLTNTLLYVAVIASDSIDFLKCSPIQYVVNSILVVFGLVLWVAGAICSAFKCELHMYKFARLVFYAPIILMACTLVYFVVGDAAVNKFGEINKYDECVKIYQYLKEYDIYDAEADLNRMCILYSTEDDQMAKNVIPVAGEDFDTLMYFGKRIRRAKGMAGGIVFADTVTIDGDWYAIYISESPDVIWLKEMNAKKLYDGVYEVFIPYGYEWSYHRQAVAIST